MLRPQRAVGDGDGIVAVRAGGGGGGREVGRAGDHGRWRVAVDEAREGVGQ